MSLAEATEILSAPVDHSIEQLTAAFHTVRVAVSSSIKGRVDRTEMEIKDTEAALAALRTNIDIAIRAAAEIAGKPFADI